MILNYNISLSTTHNLFYDNTSSSPFTENFLLDIHPLFGYKNNVPKYIWSYKSYVFNPFFFNIMNDIEPNTIKHEHNFNNLSKIQIITYYIIIQFNHNLSVNIDIAKIKQDISKLKKSYPASKINIYLPITIEHDFDFILTKLYSLENIHNCFVNTNFELKSVLQSTCFVVSNILSPLFILCYQYNKPLVVLSDNNPYRQHIAAFCSNIQLTNLNCISKNISIFLTKVFPYFECIDIHNFKFIKNPLFNFLLKQSPNKITGHCFNLNNVYVHENLNHEYINVIQGLSKSSFNKSNTIDNAHLIILSIDESPFMKSVINIKTNNYILFLDLNPNIVSNKSELLFRYSLLHNGAYENLVYPQSLNNLFYSKNVHHCEIGYVLVLLDNYNGLQYSSKSSWIEKWTPIFNKLKLYNVKVKLHPNNEIAKEILIETFNIDEKSIINKDVLLESLLSNHDIKFCVQRTGTSYIKCIQYGILIFSLNETVDYSKCIFCLDDNINFVTETYIHSKTKVFQNYINNNIIKKSELLNSNFFYHLYNYLQKTS